MQSRRHTPHGPSRAEATPVHVQTIPAGLRPGTFASSQSAPAAQGDVTPTAEDATVRRPPCPRAPLASARPDKSTEPAAATVGTTLATCLFLDVEDLLTPSSVVD
ncbi:hypothetical protein EVJ58_g9027 [Rhodofomes roseus]|uniref:Uncharacterized protein n=1 Tax=Rhodofomes roseus TaxID=34475 RepID=A0A4Y9XYC0_9APHY|nr:hypothetical protein EVJ58_g9027 [Rhodofomes roseus]